MVAQEFYFWLCKNGRSTESFLKVTVESIYNMNTLRKAQKIAGKWCLENSYKYHMTPIDKKVRIFEHKEDFNEVEVIL